jgi:hypothetical protein
VAISRYLCRVVGEQPEQLARKHNSTIRRTIAYAIAIHLPVTLWAVMGYLIPSRVFGVGPDASAAIAVFCAGLIYMVERLVLAMPKVWYVNVARLCIGFVVAALGASMVDLVIFERELTVQLRADGETRIAGEFDRKLAEQQQAVEQKKADWLKGQEAANCEANGTCGSRIRSVGPVYRELARQAGLLRSDYDAAQSHLTALADERVHAIAEWRDSPKALEEAGLLARVEALHRYTASNPMAMTAWLLFFLLVLFFELMVVFAKLVFGETVDDRLDRIREELSDHKAKSYLEAVTSPLAGARELLDSIYC